MKTTTEQSIFSSEFQAILAPLQQKELDTLQQKAHEAQEWKDKYHSLLEQLRLAKQQRFGRSSEAHIGQGELQFDEAESIEETELPKEENTLTVTYTRKKPVRRPLPKHLPRVIVEHDIPEEAENSPKFTNIIAKANIFFKIQLFGCSMKSITEFVNPLLSKLGNKPTIKKCLQCHI